VREKGVGKWRANKKSQPESNYLGGRQNGKGRPVKYGKSKGRKSPQDKKTYIRTRKRTMIGNRNAGRGIIIRKKVRRKAIWTH